MSGLTRLAPILVVAAVGGPLLCDATEPAATVTATIDFGEVHQGDVLMPCVRLTNRSGHAVHVRSVGHHASPFDVTLGPGEQVVKRLPAIDTHDYSGRMSKTFFLMLTPPGEMDAALIDGCAEGDGVDGMSGLPPPQERE